MPWRREQRVGLALLHHLARAHHVDTIGEAPHDAEVVRDEDDGHAELALEFGEDSRICACTVTSRAVVGSSAMRMSGLLASAMAIMTRWRWPPDIS